MKKILIFFVPILIIVVCVSFIIGYNLAGNSDTSDDPLSSKYISTYQEEIPNLTTDILLGKSTETSSTSSESSTPSKQGVIEEDSSRQVLQFDTALSDTEKQVIEDTYNVTFTDEPTVAGIYVVNTTDESKLTELEQDQDVTAEEDKPVKLLAQTTDWGVSRVGADKVWGDTTGTGVIVAVIDTGVQMDHPDLAGKVVTGYDYINLDDTADDENGHGTHVAGIISAINNGGGTVGVSNGVSIMPLKVLNSEGWGYLSDVAKAIYYAVDHSARVINMSLGSSYDSSVVKEAVRYAYSRGVLLVAAAGNDSGAPCNYPAAYEDVICVVATDQDNKIASFSNIGGELSAPGVSNLSTYLGSQYAYLSGTSMASPHVAGSAALLFAACSSCTNSEIRGMLRESSADLGEAGVDSLFGYGLVDVYKAINTLLHPVISSSSESSTSSSSTTSSTTLTSTPTSVSSTTTSVSSSRPQDERPSTVDQRPTLYKPEAGKNRSNKIVVRDSADLTLEYGVTPESTSTTLTKIEVYLDDEKITETTLQRDTYQLKVSELSNNQYILRLSAYFTGGTVKKESYVLDLSFLNIHNRSNDRANPDYPRNMEVLGISSSFNY